MLSSHPIKKASLGNLFKLNFEGDLGIPRNEFMSDEMPKIEDLHPKVRHWLEYCINLCQPDRVHMCDGSEEEDLALREYLRKEHMVEDLPKMKNCILATTDPRDVARVEAQTFISTENERETHPILKKGVKGKLGNWISPIDYTDEKNERFPGCMRGRTMYIIPFSMGVLGSPLAKVGIQITDSAYVVCSMRIMTRMGHDALDWIDHHGGYFVKCLHSVGQPLPMAEAPISNWPCNPEEVMILHRPYNREIVSFGSGYGGNSLLGKKCFALRIGCTIGRDEGWLAEHMLIVGVTPPNGKKHYIAAAFPSQCGKTNLAMMSAELPGYKIECVGDDIAWMKWDEKGQLRGINPENGFFGVAPGTSHKTNPNAMEVLKENTIFTNVGRTSDGGVFWEGLEDEMDLEKLENKFLWPGFGQNLRVLDWVLRRLEGEDCAVPSPIGLLPKPGSVNVEGLNPKPNMDELFSLPKDFWEAEVQELRKYFKEQVGDDFPLQMWNELDALEKRVQNM
ncbi:unnamed protein product [Darwinula stevensoni]|uniref:Phosphoenolpyruvate carboxykinase [GTP] n=1 Tax=Darwinula stevensoni TaxID=69355 RepID=A0A7R9A7I7_9CRUS|nr:unnamed protein product [Darwinula stevensoni]CAG0891996.1 unnamed protein product [Darwinula stevensoni]